MWSFVVAVVSVNIHAWYVCFEPFNGYVGHGISDRSANSPGFSRSSYIKTHIYRCFEQFPKRPTSNMASPSFNDACMIFVGDICRATVSDPQGDSITQTSAPGTYYQLLSEYYERRLDVLNRGLSGGFQLSYQMSGSSAGYNTRLGLAAFKRMLSPKDQRRQEIRLLTIWFGECIWSYPS
jgi:hypothetical protein